MEKEYNDKVIEVVLKEPIIASEICGGYTSGTIKAIRYNKNHFNRYIDDVKVFMMDGIACGIQGWSKNKLEKFIQEKGLHSRIIE